MKRAATLGIAGLASLGMLSACTTPPASSDPTTTVAPTPAPHVQNTTAVPMTGRLADGTGAVQGTFTLREVVEQSGGMAAVGTFTGTVTDAAGTVTEGSQELTIPVEATTSPAPAAAGTETAADCPILHLNLAPLHLDLLGLVVDLNRVVLDIVATPGAGALLGNLLCTVTGLLDGLGTLAQIIAIINQIIAFLGSLAPAA